jgi:hypothetical protein
MATTHASTVTALYLAFYGRPADPAGLTYWADQLAKANGNVDAIKGFFANSTEAQVRFGSDTAAERVTQIYQQLFNRAPEADGLNYWVDVISKGHASVADVAITIMNGARGSDLSLSTLRQQAADSFTTQVAASGSAYSGVAAVEVARVLVRAVTPAASKSDVEALVKSTMTLTSVASTSPDVIKAIGSGNELLGLLDTSKGGADTVALVETLAETARGASSDAHLLASLVKGGGMHNLLKVLPEGMTIKDLKATMDKGGLPAALKALKLDLPATPGKPGSGDGSAGTATLAFDLAASPDKLVLKAGTATVTGLSNPAGLKLEDIGSGTAKPTAVNYLDGLTVESGALVFKGELAAGLYQMSWAAGSFATASGQLAAGSAVFAGGRDGVFVQEGFTVAKSTTVSGDLARAHTEGVNEAFIANSSTKASIATGGGHDLVVDNGGTLSLVYDSFGGASDLILGFDTGNDSVVLKGELAAALDGNADGKLQWAGSKAVEATAEAVSITVGAELVMGSAAALPKTLEVLNAALDVSKVAANGELLILAKDAGDAAALFLYVNKDNDGTIDAEELTQLAMFADGAPSQGDIVLVGAAAAPAA